MGVEQRYGGVGGSCWVVSRKLPNKVQFELSKAQLELSKDQFELSKDQF